MQELVVNKKLYHFDSFDNEEMWHEGNEFKIDKNYTSFAGFFFKDEPIYYDKEKKIKLFDAIDYAKRGLLTKEEYIDLSNKLKVYLYNEPISYIEYILESIRRLEYPTYVSRAHCLYLTDYAGIDFWKEHLRAKNLYEVLVSGKLFQSYNVLLPDYRNSIENRGYQARCYWRGDLGVLPFEHKIDDKEYLFQGRVKVLRKL